MPPPSLGEVWPHILKWSKIPTWKIMFSILFLFFLLTFYSRGNDTGLVLPSYSVWLSLSRITVLPKRKSNSYLIFLCNKQTGLLAGVPPHPSQISDSHLIRGRAVLRSLTFPAGLHHLAYFLGACDRDIWMSKQENFLLERCFRCQSLK